jgi:hypothetical protein
MPWTCHNNMLRTYRYVHINTYTKEKEDMSVYQKGKN